MLELFLKGLIIGFAIAAPVGPIGVLCIQRSLRDGFKVGLMTGMGAAVADGVYGLIPGLGLTAISSLLVSQQFWIRLFGGLFLIYLGIKMISQTSNKKNIYRRNSNKSIWNAFSTTFFLTLTNPVTILSFAAIFASIGLDNSSANYYSATILVAGITLGSAIWWLILSGSISFGLYRRVNNKILKIVNWASAIVMLAFGVYALAP
ncbi:MAG TPA: LysE family transporter [Gammaproteobacteria bacterium]|nr:LysE family transporter [Gammaproteobacteria bacterium]